ncbi:SLAM family member 9-like isoform X2 [Hemicordylus capensis]|uniref:SLAM family member 9-like isoform X2 n=1 Tax=Hemicordylus capensis TaxID=884348 RepID=UPI0023035645|nr:SLAM family member 9-like isoform X2 [Hemicordylus capensis]
MQPIHPPSFLSKSHLQFEPADVPRCSWLFNTALTLICCKRTISKGVCMCMCMYMKDSAHCRTQMVLTMKCTSRNLELPLLLGTLISSFLGTGSHQAKNPPQQMNRVLGGSVVFSVNVTGSTVEEFEWTFQNKTQFQIVRFAEGKWKWSVLRDSFGQRIEITNDTTLKISHVEREDSGVYGLRVTFHTEEIQVDSFSLTVFEPVPEPHISPQLISRASDGCNVTLQCQLPRKGEFNITWESGNTLQDSEDGSVRYQISSHGRDLHLFWQASSSDSTITCRVSNPADWKNVSFNLHSICSDERKQLVGAIVSTTPGKDRPPDPIYDETPDGEMDECQDAETFPDLDQNSRMNSITVYATLQFPSQLPGLAT